MTLFAPLDQCGLSADALQANLGPSAAWALSAIAGPVVRPPAMMRLMAEMAIALRESRIRLPPVSHNDGPGHGPAWMLEGRLSSGRQTINAFPVPGKPRTNTGWARRSEEHT